MLVRRILPALTVMAGLLLPPQAYAHTEDKSAVASQQLTDTIYLITGRGGNIGVSIGEDGTFLIDDKFLDMGSNILKEIEKLGGSTPQFTVNTHYHGDHTGSNLTLGEQGSTIVAHENVRKQLAQGSVIKAFLRTTPPQPKAALPVITYSDKVSFHINNEDIQVIHIAKAHTDGDSIVHFSNSNVIHTGDLFFNGFYPFIDVEHGGSLKGMIKAAEVILSLSDENTQIIPGHGPMASKADLETFHGMLNGAYKALSPLKAAGKSIEQAISEKPLAAFDARWSNGIFKTDRWIRLIYDRLD